MLKHHIMKLYEVAEVKLHSFIITALEVSRQILVPAALFPTKESPMSLSKKLGLSEN
jgi:hypothetical protein